MFRTLLAAMAALVLTLTVSPACAQRALSFDAAKGYDHPHTGLKMPGTLIGTTMGKLSDLSNAQLDVIALYEDPAGKELISIYVYRLVSGGLPVWFDRAVWAIENRTEMYGKTTRLAGPASFVPPSQQTASALTATWTSSRSYRSTGLVLIQMGDWLVKIRYSSGTLDAPQTAAKLREIAAALGWPSGIAASPAAYEVQPCTTSLKLSGEAVPLPLNSSAVTAGAITGAAEAENPSLRSTAPKRWCRDATTLPTGGVYRGDEETNGYLIALSDAGRGIRVQPDQAMRELSLGAGWSIQFIDIGRTVNLISHDRLPPPAQALASLRTARPVAVFETFGKERQLQIITPD